MIKQIFGNLPRKPSKSSHNDADPNGEGEVNSYNIPNSSNISRPSSKSPTSNSHGANGTLAPSSTSSNRTNQVKKPLGDGVYEALPSFRDVPNLEKPNLFVKKLSMCCVVFDFSDPAKNLKEKEIKRQTLLELVDHIATVSVKLSDAAMQEITKMAVANMFRTFPSENHESKILGTLDVDDEEPALEPDWPHLQVV